MLKDYTLIDDYTTNNSKRYVKLLNGFETNDYIIVYYDDAGEVTGYYKSHFLYSMSFDSGKDKFAIQADVNFDKEVKVDGENYTFDSIIKTKDYYIGQPDEFLDYQMNYIKVFYLKYVNKAGYTIVIKKYYNHSLKSFFDASKLKVDIEI